MRSNQRAFLLGLLALIVVAVGCLILWPHDASPQQVASDDPVTISAPDVDPPRAGWTVAPTTTTSPPPTTSAPRTPTTTRAPNVKPKAVVPNSGVSAFLACVRYHESGDRYHAGPAGAYGILVSTWQNRTLGYSARYGTATAGSAGEAAQDAAARDLFARYGSKPWTTRRLCGG